MRIFASHHVGIVVADMGKSLAFYRDIFGFKLQMERRITTPWVGAVNGVPNAQLHVVFLEGYGQRIELLAFAPSEENLPREGANRPGRVHLTFQVEDLAEAIEILEARGVELVAPAQTNTEGPNAGSKVVFLFDPDGVRIELVQPPPGRAQFP